MLRLFLSLNLSMLVCCIQAQQFTSMFNFGDFTQEHIHAYTSDDEGNVYLLASNNGMLYYGDLSFPSTFGQNVFAYLMKIDPQGNYLWHQTFEFSNNISTRGKRMVVDADHNIYFTANYAGDANLQGNILTPYMSNFGYLTAKCNPQGEVLWVQAGGGHSIFLSEDNTLSVLHYNSPSGMIAGEEITNEEGCVYKMDLDGNYIGHLHAELGDYSAFYISGIKTNGEYYGYRVTNVNGNTNMLEALLLDQTGTVISSQVVNYAYLYDEPSRFLHDPVSGNYYMTGKFRNRSPFNSPEGIMLSSLMLIKLDSDLNITGTMEMGPALTNNGGIPDFTLLTHGGNLYLTGVITTIPIAFWTSLGQGIYLDYYQGTPIFAKINSNLETVWYKQFPTTYYSVSLFPYLRGDEVELLAMLPSIEMDGISIEALGGNDITLIHFDDNDNASNTGSGSVYVDANANGIRDTGEIAATGIHITNSIYPGNHYYSNADGHFELSLGTGMQQITCDGLPPYWYHTTPSSLDVTSAPDQPETNDLDFGITPLPDIQDLSVIITSTNFPNVASTVLYTIDLCNTGTITESGTLAFIADNVVSDLIATPEGIQSLDTLFLPYTDLLSGECMQFHIQGNIPADVDLLNTGIYTEVFTLSAVNDTTPENNADSLEQIIIGPYDPNSIAVSPECAISDPFIDTEQELEYMIRFQNLGSDSAINVTVRAPLSPYLDATTFDFISSSHAAAYEIVNDEIIISYINIQLPHADANEAASQGYFRFTIRPLVSISAGSVIEETAAIFFDLNPPVITNTASTAFVEPSDLVEITATPASCPATSDGALQIAGLCANAGITYSFNGEPFGVLSSSSYENLPEGDYPLVFMQYGDTLYSTVWHLETQENEGAEVIASTGSCIFNGYGSFDIALSCVPIPYSYRLDGGPVFTSSETHFEGLNAGLHHLIIYTLSDSLEVDIEVDSLPTSGFTGLFTPPLLCPQDSGSIVISNSCILSNAFSYSIDNGPEQSGILDESIPVPSGSHQLFVHADGIVLYDGSYQIDFLTSLDTTVTVEVGIMTAANASADAVYTWYDCNTEEMVSTESNPTFAPDYNGSFYFTAITTEGCNFQSSCHSVIIDAVQENETISSIVYPNPSDGNFFIAWSGLGTEVELQINTVQGHLVEKHLLNGKNQYNIQIDTPGVYTLTLTGKNQHIVRRLAVH